MSMHQNFVAFSLYELIKIPGSKDEKILKKLQDFYESNYSPLIFESRGDFDSEVAVLKNIVMGNKISKRDVVQGNIKLNCKIRFNHVVAMVACQDYIPIESKSRPFFDYFVELVNWRLKGRAKELVDHLASGRPFFGDWHSSEFPYSFLTLAEVNELLKYIEKDEGPFLVDWDKGKAFQGWLKEISKAKKDLFHYID